MTLSRKKAEEKIRKETNFFIREDGELFWQDSGESIPLHRSSDSGRLYEAAVSQEERLMKIEKLAMQEIAIWQIPNKVFYEILSLAKGEQ